MLKLRSIGYIIMLKCNTFVIKTNVWEGESSKGICPLVLPIQHQADLNAKLIKDKIGGMEMKKFLSIILALAMLMSLVPAAFATEGETETREYSGITVKYDFTNFEGAASNVVVNELAESYNSTYGFWKYRGDGNDRDATLLSKTDYGTDDSDDTVLFVKYVTNNTIYNDVTGKNENDFYIAFELNVPAAGYYNVKLNNVQVANYGATAQLYIFPGTVADDELVSLMKKDDTYLHGSGFEFCNTALKHNRYGSKEEILGDKYFEKANYIFVYAVTKENAGTGLANRQMGIKGITLDGDGDTAANYVPIVSSLSATANDDGTTTVKAEAKYMSDAVAEATDVAYTYAVAEDDTDKAEIINGNIVKGKANGTATIIATATKNGLSSSKSIEVAVTKPVTEEPDYTADLTNAFAHESTTANAVTIPTSGVTVNTYVYTVDGTKKSLDATETVSAGKAYEVDAGKITGMDGREFLYWAKGLSMDKKQIVSGNAKYSFIPTVEATHLIAVFAPITEEGEAKAEFYNGNGQLLPDYTVTSDEKVTIPELPSMAGYGDATHWELYGDTTEYKEGDNVPLSGSMIFVAQYKDLEEKNAVTVNGGSCDKTAYKYGDVVTCTPTTTENFVCWKKDGVIVSMDPTYTFNAWETCTVEAVYGNHEFAGKATKLLIDIINDKFIMAEFIGLSNYGNVVEKGVMIGNKRFAMQKPLATQFTLEAENATEAATAVAYAIFDNGIMITDK